MVEAFDHNQVEPLATTQLFCESVCDSGFIRDPIIDGNSLFRELLTKEQTTMTTIWLALVNNSMERRDEALLIAFFDSKEEIARKQREERINGKHAPLMSLMLLESGLVTKKQIEDGLIEQRNLYAGNQPNALLGEIIFHQLKTNIERAVQSLWA